MVTNEQINEAFEAAAVSRQSLYQVGGVYEASKQIFERASAYAISDGLIEGKNKEQRDAALVVNLSLEYDALYKAEIDLREAKLNHDLNIFELGRVKALLRLMEVEATLSQLTIE